MRPRDLNALPDLLRLSRDASPDVRFWAMRGLGQPAPPAPPRGGGAPPTPPVPFTPMTETDRATCSARLREGVVDPDRRVRTEALRALTTYDDDASFAIVLKSIDSADSWISVSAVEQLGKFASRKDRDRPEARRRERVRQAARRPPHRARAARRRSRPRPRSIWRRRCSTSRTPTRAPRRSPRCAVWAPTAARASTPRSPPIPTLTPLATPPARSPAPARAARTRRRLPHARRRSGSCPTTTARRSRTRSWTRREATIEIELYPGDAPFGVEYFARRHSTSATSSAPSSRAWCRTSSIRRKASAATRRCATKSTAAASRAAT